MMTLEQIKENHPGDWVASGNGTCYIKYADRSSINYDAQGFYYDEPGEFMKIIGKDQVNRLMQKKNALMNFK